MWDLHVHTPESIENNYNGPDPWDRFLSELSQLPADIKVLGINDYWFLDGYERVRSAFDAGRLPNLEQIFPVLEVRCDTFGGVDGALSRLNLHMICDPILPVETLKAQLLPYMKATYRLSPDDAPLTWSQFPTRESLVDLGNKVIESAPEEHRSTYPSPLRTGFNNLNVSFETIRAGVLSNTALDHHVALAIGKTEWADIKWGQAAAAQKKHLINSVAAVFTAAPSRDAFERSRQSLIDNGVSSRLLDCSDAHTWMDSDQAARLGACFTWINADPTFKGLLQALQEYPARVCTDERPAVLTRVARAPRTVITDAAIRPTNPAATPSPLFDAILQINPGFTVVIGNKGQGKSALLDCIALASNSDRFDDFSFLSPERFRSGGGRTAGLYEVEVSWADSSKTEATLDADFDESSPILVDYLPQSLIEKVCSADPDSTEKRHFEAEIERVLFRHIAPEARGSSTTLSQHLESQARDERSKLDAARGQMALISRELVDATERHNSLESLGLSQRLQTLEQQRQTLLAEIEGVDAELATGGTEQQNEVARTVRSAVLERDAIEARVSASKDQQEALAGQVEDIQILVAELRSTVSDARDQATQIASTVGVNVERILRTQLDESPVHEWTATRSAERAALQADLESAGGLIEQSRVAVRKVADLEVELESTGAEVHRLHQHRSDLAAQLTRIEGDPSDPQSIAGITTLTTELAQAPDRIDALWAQLEAEFRAAHDSLLAIMALQRGAYGPATDFIAGSELANSVGLAFDVEFRVREFVDSWIGMVNRQRLGEFPDVDRRDRDRAVLADVPLDDADQLLAALQGLIRRLGSDRGSEAGAPRPLSSIMRAAYDAKDLITAVFDLSWLESQYIIRSEGAELSELSPGQRGLVLLLFYLLVDTSERPLLLDQPEENLDNQTVRTSLVPAMREATGRRQVIAVTHNPNLAVVGDADQIIVASAAGAFHYESGSLADPPVGLKAIDVLEGTRGAFTSRELKYDQVVGTAE